MIVSKLVAIHQPNFFPWLGFFDKLARADVFILMDNAQFSKTGGTWTNRARLIVNGSPAWLTIPIERAYHGTRYISEMKINDSTPWREKFIRTLQMNYSRAAHFKHVLPIVEGLIRNPTESLAVFNMNAIRRLMLAIELDPAKLVLGSSLEAEGHSTELLIAMTKAVGGTCYLSGDGSAGYLRAELFVDAGLALKYQDFRHPEYLRGKQPFVPGLSVVDALMHCGLEGVRALISR